LLKNIFGSKKNEAHHSDCAVKACYVLCLPHVCRSLETCPPFVLPGDGDPRAEDSCQLFVLNKISQARKTGEALARIGSVSRISNRKL